MGYLDNNGLNYLVNKLDKRFNSLKITSKIERIGQYRYLIIKFPFSAELQQQLSNGNIELHLFKQSKKKVNRITERNAYFKWCCPLSDFGVASEHFIASFEKEGYNTAGIINKGVVKPRMILNGENDLLNISIGDYAILTYNLSELAKRMTYSVNGNNVLPCEYAGQKYSDTAIAMDNPRVIGKQITNNNCRVALRYKFALYFNDTNAYGDFTDTITILYTKDNVNFLKTGMQIN